MSKKPTVTVTKDGPHIVVAVGTPRRYVEVAAACNVHEDGTLTPLHRLCVWVRTPQDDAPRFVAGVSYKPNKYATAHSAAGAASQLLPDAMREAGEMFPRRLAVEFGRRVLAVFQSATV